MAALVRQGGDPEALAGLTMELEEPMVTGGALQARPCHCDPHSLQLLDGLEARCVLCGRGERV